MTIALLLAALIASACIVAHLRRSLRWLRERERIKNARALARMGAHVSRVSTPRVDRRNVVRLHSRGTEPPNRAA